MIWVYLFVAALIATLAHALWFGGAPERWTAAIFALSASAGVMQAHRPDAYAGIFWSIAAIDLVTLLALIALAVAADRYWPLWIAALQLFTVSFHVVRTYDPGIFPYAYWLLTGKIAYVQLVLLVIGTIRHRARVAERGDEFGWTVNRHAAVRASSAGAF